MNKFELVTVDNGYADHKVAFFDKTAGAIKLSKVPAIIATGHTMSTATGEPISAYTVLDGKFKKEFTCSANAPAPVSLRHGNYPLAVENRVLFTHALNSMGLLEKPLKVSVTLPFADYYLSGGKVNSELVNKVVSNFTANNVQSDSGETKGAKAAIHSARVSPEAVAAWFDWAMDDLGQITDNYDEMLQEEGIVLVVDVGGSTTDIVALGLSPELTVLSERSGTTKLGVLDAVDYMVKGATEELRQLGVDGLDGHDSVLSDRVRKVMFETGFVRVGGKRYDMSHVLERACKSVADEILNFIRNTAGNIVSYFSIIVVGGGSIVFQEQLRELLPNPVFLDEYANARGALKLLISMEGGEVSGG